MTRSAAAGQGLEDGERDSKARRRVARAGVARDRRPAAFAPTHPLELAAELIPDCVDAGLGLGGHVVQLAPSLNFLALHSDCRK